MVKLKTYVFFTDECLGYFLFCYKQSLLNCYLFRVWVVDGSSGIAYTPGGEGEGQRKLVHLCMSWPCRSQGVVSLSLTSQDFGDRPKYQVSPTMEGTTE